MLKRTLLCVPALAGGLAQAALSSFGGMNHHFLQFLAASERNSIISSLVAANASVIRLFVREEFNTMEKGSKVRQQSDVENSVGNFNLTTLDTLDDTLAAIHTISNGTIKVIIAPHDSTRLRAINGAPCDAYCQVTGTNWQSFYTDSGIRKSYKARLTAIFNTYKSKNFGASWSTLDEVIAGVDLQNEPWAGVYPIPSGEDWICDIAAYLRTTVGLGANNIAVISGGISGANSIAGSENWPDVALNCSSLDVIALHGYFGDGADYGAGTPWSTLLSPSSPLILRQLHNRRLVLVESWSYTPSSGSSNTKQGNIYDQIVHMNYRGVPWIYDNAISTTETTSADVNVLDTSSSSAWSVFKFYTLQAWHSTSPFDWSRYAVLTPPPYPTKYPVGAEQYGVTGANGSCTFGCGGWLCETDYPCGDGYVCRDNVCQRCSDGCIGQACPCQDFLECDSTSNKCVRCSGKNGVCLGSTPNAVGCNAGARCINDLFCMTGVCMYPAPPVTYPSGPCKSQADCSANQMCSSGACTTCSGQGCLGAACSAAAQCESGNCSAWGVCEVAKWSYLQGSG